MRKLVSAIAFLLFAFNLAAQAQLSQSSEPKPKHDLLTGEVIIMPVILRHDAPKLAAARLASVKAARPRNRAQLRLNKFEEGKNGYYRGDRNRDWGTNIRLNSFLFLPDVTGL